MSARTPSAAPADASGPVSWLGSLHPQDGPDVDLRVEVGSERVRLDLGLNLAMVDELLEPTREEMDALHEVEARGLRAPLLEALRPVLGLRIDGVEVTPVELDFSWQDADPTLVPLFPTCGARALIQLRYSLEYPVKSPPARVALRWGLYPPDVALAPRPEAPPIEIRALLSAGTEELWIGLSEEQPEFVWSGQLRPRGELFESVPDPLPQADLEGLVKRSILLGVSLLALLAGCFLLRRLPALGWPLFAIGVAGAAWVAKQNTSSTPALDTEQALAVFRPLHANIYRAFDYDTESDVYDALERSVEGKLLDRLYDEIYTDLVLADDGGAVCKVTAVDLLESEVQETSAEDAAALDARAPGRTFDVTARWTVAGQVHHWGHSHSRTNEYQARYTVVARDAGWRIAGSQLLEQRRLESAPLEPLRGQAIPEEL